MAPPNRSGFTGVVRIVRADAPPAGTAPRPLTAAPASSSRAPTPSPSPAPADGRTVNGVPVSAAQHCCGKGCRHCRIYASLRKL